MRCGPHLNTLIVGAVGLGLPQERQEPSHGHLMVEYAFARIKTWKKRNQFNHFNICWLSNKVDTCRTFLFGNFLTKILLIWNWKFEQNLLYVFLVSIITSLSPLKRRKTVFHSRSVDIRPLLPLQEGSCSSKKNMSTFKYARVNKWC